MPETSVAEAPLTKISPALKSFMEIPEPEENEPEPETPAAKPAVPETPPAAKVEEPAAEPVKDALRARLAPDLPTAAEPQTPEPTPAEQKPFVTQEMLDAEKDPKRRESLRKMGEQVDQYKKEAEQLRRQIATPAEDTGTKELLAKIQKERDELLEKVTRLDLTQHPQFQQQYIAPREKAFQDASQIVRDSGGDPTAVARAMGLTGKPRLDALEEIADGIENKMARGRFERAVETIDEKTREINEKLRNAKQTSEELRRQDTISREEQLQQESKQWKGLLSAAHRNLLENHKLEPLQKVDKPGYEWWNEQADEILTVAEDILLKATPEKAATAAVLAGSADAFRKMWLAEKAARIALDKEVAELRGAEPSLTRERPQPKPAAGENREVSDILADLRAGKFK